MRTLKDLAHHITVPMPDGSSAETTAASAALDLGHDSGEFNVPHELVISLPSMAVAKLGNAKIATIKIQDSSQADFSSDVRDTFGTALAVATGNTADGSNAIERRMVLPADVKRYVRAYITSDNDLDASAIELTMDLMF